jgi:hypothetical protein
MAVVGFVAGAAGVDGLKLFERLTGEVDSWFTQHLRDLAFTEYVPSSHADCHIDQLTLVRGSAGEVTKEQEVSIRKKALRERDIIFSKVLLLLDLVW